MLDREGPVPLYRQIVQIIHERIVCGDLSEGQPVPSEAALEAEFRIARTTARRVTRELRERGLAYTIRGEGTFVGGPDAPRVRRRMPRYQEIAEEIAQQIDEGRLPPNRPIPSEKDLMRRYSVAKVTARQAVGHLRELGLVFTVPHRGTYVTMPESRPEER
jgi:DNA-binding GntR family transcriptional regulator